MSGRFVSSSGQVSVPTHYFLVASYCAVTGVRSVQADCDQSNVKVMSLILPHKPAVTSTCWASITALVSKLNYSSAAVLASSRQLCSRPKPCLSESVL